MPNRLDQELVTQPGDRSGPMSWLELGLVALPLLALLSQLLSWLTYGIDLPSLDDWRDVEAGTAGSFDPGYLFESANDTAYPVGKALDGLALRFLGGNAIPYQAVSMVAVLGSLAGLQFLLLRSVARDRVAAISAFGVTVLMMQPGTYWGSANLAYHQAVPLVGVLVILWVATADTWRRFLSPLAIFASALIAGFIYISGAVACAVLLALLMFVAIAVPGAVRRQLMAAAGAMAIPTMLSVIVQLRVIVVVQGGTRGTNNQMALPWQLDYWAFALGKFARSLFLPRDMPYLSLFVTAIVLMITVGLILRALRDIVHLRSQGGGDKTPSMHNARYPTILLGLVGVILSYLMLVSAGRTNLRGADVTGFINVFTFGFRRFHFFWIVLLWPWVFLGTEAAIARRGNSDESNRGRVRSDRRRLVPSQRGAWAAGVMVAAIACFGLFGHREEFRLVSSFRLAELACIQDDRTGARSPRCQKSTQRAPTTRAVNYAVERGFTFTRTLPERPQTTAGSGGEFVVVGSFGVADVAAMTVENGVGSVVVVDGVEVFRVDPEPDTRLLFVTGEGDVLAGCGLVGVDVVLVGLGSGSGGDVAQLFVDPVGSAGFGEESSVVIARSGRVGWATLKFVASSSVGFDDRFRLDASRLTEPFAIEKISVLCSRE